MRKAQVLFQIPVVSLIFYQPFAVNLLIKLFRNLKAFWKHLYTNQHRYPLLFNSDPFKYIFKSSILLKWNVSRNGYCNSRMSLVRFCHFSQISTASRTLVLKHKEVCRKATHLTLWRASPVVQWDRIHLQCRDTGLIPGSGRSSGGGNGDLLQYSSLKNPTDRGT